MKYVIFDFNGTVLDDTDVCVKIENESLKRFLPEKYPLSKDEYLHVFSFPVKQYYEKIGYTWEKHTFEEVSEYWMNLYNRHKEEYKLHDGVLKLLNLNHQKGYKNILLSVSSLEQLKRQLKELNISELFDEVLGISDIYAHSKIEIGKKWIQDKNPDDCIMIGDTIHDLEVANAMKVKCVLVANGHQAKDVLQAKHDKVVDNINEVQI